ncbi:hypothetical protein K501DRAFT_213041 [Backusella circina FSU 941]|nr:hypothetical protein K501DRAFT_213041 [Backusella circina FSU 941]
MKRVYNGVKAEPKFLRDPTSLESISSGISRLSGYVASNLPKRRQSAPVEHYAPFIQDEPAEKEEEHEEPTDTITFATFSKLNIQSDTRNCLLLGYQDGFQVWDISNPDNIHELCSLRNKEMFGIVTFIHYLDNSDEQTLVIVCEAETNEIPNDATSFNKNQLRSSIVKMYSLKSQSIIHQIQEKDTQVTCIKSNHKVIVLGCLSHTHSSIQILSISDFSPMTSPLTDVYHENGPIFTLGTRFIAYATNTAVLNSDPVMSALTNKGIGYTGIGVLQGEKDVKGAAKDIVKEVASGMKSLGELGYSRLSNYFNNHNLDVPQKEHLITGGIQASSSSSSLSSTITTATISTTSTKKQTPMGMIMIRDLQKLTPYNNNNNNLHNNKSYNTNSNSVIAHFRPHTHAISYLTFNSAGTLLLSASKQGHTFHIFSILTSSTAHVAHLYSLSRGITDAQVVDCQFSVDSTWCAVSTARGTTHLYAINPYGEKPDISSHVHSKVNNRPQPLYHHTKQQQQPAAMTLNSIIRIKQRKRMPLNESDEPPSREPRAHVSTLFVRIPKASTILQSTVSSSLTAPRQEQSLGSMMLSSLGSSLPPKWMKSNDPLMFGFDDEELDDDDDKMMSDEMGYQDIYSFHPDGFLTLHRCWVAKVVVRKRESHRVFDKTDFSIKEEDVAEWRVSRNSEWDQVMMPSVAKAPSRYDPEVAPPPQKRWLSNAEINTCADRPALWTHQQFSFQTYNDTGNELQRLLGAGRVPPTNKIVMLKGLPEPISSRLDRVKKMSSRITTLGDDDMNENLDDALAELEDNISKAMQTSFSPSTSIGNSPSSFKWLSSSAAAASPNTPRSLMMMDHRKASISFEDAYLINMASDPMQHSALIQFDDSDDDDDVIRLDQEKRKKEDIIFSPDGDNEIASPSDSFFGGHFGQDKTW